MAHPLVNLFMKELAGTGVLNDQQRREVEKRLMRLLGDVEASNRSASSPMLPSGGNKTYTSTFSARPVPDQAGDLFLPSDGIDLERYDGTAWRPWGPLFPFTAPVSADFTWINQGTASVDTTKGGIYLLAPILNGNNLRIRKKTAPSTPYTITAALMPQMMAAHTPVCGLLFRESSSGKLQTFHVTYSNTILPYHLLGVSNWSSPSDSAPPALYYDGIWSTFPIWLRITWNGTTTRTFDWSVDGQHFHNFYSTGTGFLTPDEVGFFVQPGSPSYPAAVTLLSWAES